MVGVDYPRILIIGETLDAIGEDPPSNQSFCAALGILEDQWGGKLKYIRRTVTQK